MITISLTYLTFNAVAGGGALPGVAGPRIAFITAFAPASTVKCCHIPVFPLLLSCNAMIATLKTDL